jgi:hypothetical protein
VTKAASLSVRNGGWIRYEYDGLVADLRVGIDGNRLRVRELYLGTDRITTDTLRAIPIGRIESWCNGADMRKSIEARLEIPVPDLRALSDEFGTVHVDQTKHRRRALRIRVPSTSDYGDDFYKRIADVYTVASIWGSRPAADIAEANDVPVSTVHRWVKEARARKFLSAGRRKVE